MHLKFQIGTIYMCYSFHVHYTALHVLHVHSMSYMCWKLYHNTRVSQLRYFLVQNVQSQQFSNLLVRESGPAPGATAVGLRATHGDAVATTTEGLSEGAELISASLPGDGP